MRKLKKIIRQLYLLDQSIINRQLNLGNDNMRENILQPDPMYFKSSLSYIPEDISDCSN
jgi:hypothetical protein